MKATELADELERLARLLEIANGQRAQAGQAVPDFRGVFANQYQRELTTHVNQVTDTITRFLTTAGALRDAIAEHRARASRELGAP